MLCQHTVHSYTTTTRSHPKVLRPELPEPDTKKNGNTTQTKHIMPTFDQKSVAYLIE